MKKDSFEQKFFSFIILGIIILLSACTLVGPQKNLLFIIYMIMASFCYWIKGFYGFSSKRRIVRFQKVKSIEMKTL